MNKPKEIALDKKITLLKGDIFSSQLQTITIPVNTFGVMGKGLALKFKKKFPDIYNNYRSLCRQKKLKIGVPHLDNQERDSQTDFFRNNSSANTKNNTSLFLFFPTKNHWRAKSSIKEIEEGLIYLSEKYKSLKIKSIAFPALGCGFGGLDWKDMGPLMCSYLKKMNIKAEIYLPIDKEIPKEHLTAEFLLNRK